MSLFEKKLSLKSLFEGYVDYHCHILPGVDDGVRRMDDSISILSRYAEAGVREVWLTPHVMEDCPNTPDMLKDRFEELKYEIDKAGIRCPELHLSAENMMDELFEERLAKKNVLPHMPRCLLVETSYYNPPIDLYGTLSKVKSAGYFPILAHPERYIYMDDRDYKRLKEMDVRFQLNISSFSGFYGPDAKKKAERMLKLGYYNCTGTDLHRQSMLDRYFDTKVGEKTLGRIDQIKNDNSL